MEKNAANFKSRIKFSPMAIAIFAVAIGVFLFKKPEHIHRDVIRVEAAAPELTKPMETTGESTSPGYPVKVVHEMNAQEQKQLETLAQILSARNDNDPRMDTELKVLSPALREKLREEYQLMSPEKLNDRGTIVFLLGRNLETETDFRFMQKVLQESTCKSFTDCTRDAVAAAPGDDQHSPGEEVTLSYPQQTAFKAIENLFERRPLSELSSAERKWAQDILDAAVNSPVPSISARARALNEQLRQ